MLSEFWQKQWDDIRPSLKWSILYSLVLSISGSGFFLGYKLSQETRLLWPQRCGFSQLSSLCY